MSDTKDNGGFLRRVARLVSHPTPERAEQGESSRSAREAELAKSEMKEAMERKRRNDFVRKREFDMLRRVRREGLNESTVGAMPHSNIDSDVRFSDWAPRSDIAVRDKIDAIERQMDGETVSPRSSGFFSVPPSRSPGNSTLSSRSIAPSVPPKSAAPQPAPQAAGATVASRSPAAAQPAVSAPAAAARPAPVAAAPVAPRPAPAAAQKAPAVAPEAPAAPSPAPRPAAGGGGVYDNTFSVEVSEVVHDPQLDEVVIAFANADFSGSESSLRALVEPGAGRADHPDTWLVLFDLYRATGQQAKFESLALDYVNSFSLSPPQWFSLPRLVAESVHESRAAPVPAPPQAAAPTVGWTAPEVFDTEALEGLRAQVAKLSSPWVLDWAPLKRIEAAVAMPLCQMLRGWSRERHEMRLLASEHLLGVLQEATPAGERDVDPSMWLLRMEVLRLVNRPDQYDETAIDYCVTYEVSPPAWDPSRCQVLLDDQKEAPDSGATPLSVIGEVSTKFVESDVPHEPGFLELVSVELSGQLVGDISAVLQDLENRLGKATLVTVSCLKLIRVDFIAAGDLLNWVLTRNAEGRTVVFEDAHRLLALFFGAMGITEHARVKVRNN